MDRIENCAFGAKVQSAKEKPKGAKERIRSKTSLPMEKRFGDSVMVENLAYIPNVSPLPPMKPILRRRRWKKGDNAFLVIKRDHNNNDNQERWIIK